MLETLLSPVKLGDIELANRVIMAPMTRSRANPEDDCANDLMVEYYRQRATAGLIISEGVHPSADGKGYCRTPGIFNQVQIDSWRRVTDAVHGRGGKIVAQVMHVGRAAHADNKAAGTRTVAPSAIAAKAEIYTDTKGMQPMAMPEALTTEEVKQVVEQYAQATRNALAAGFDGVELHCTSGYLPAQFLSTGSNQRDDQYGGSVENRVRFVIECLQAMCAVAGPGRVGFRICPDNPFNDLSDENPEETFRTLLTSVRDMGLAYCHVIRFRGRVDNIALALECFGDNLIINDSYKPEKADAAIADGQAKAVSFGRLFIGNPDLVERLRDGKALAEFDLSSLYTPGAKGYTDYPNAD